MARKKSFPFKKVVIVLVAIVLIGLIGWRLWDMSQGNNVETSQTVPAVPEVTSEADLDKASAALDAINIEGNESKELDSQTAF